MEETLSDKIDSKIELDRSVSAVIRIKDIKEAVKRLKFKFRKLSQKTPGGLDEFFEEIDKIFGDKLI